MALSNSQYDAILRTYHVRQAENARGQAARIAEVEERIPEYKKLSEEIGRAALRRGKEILSGRTEAAGELKEEIAALSRRKEELLIRAGYPADYTGLRYTCPDCKDTGFINGEKCHCFLAREIELLYDQSNLRGILEQENFDRFSYEYFDDRKKDPRTGMTVREYMEGVASRCRKFADDFGRDGRKGNLLFTGKTGLGKTYLSHCIARELIDRRFSVVYLPAAEMFDIFSRDKFDPDSDEEDRDRSRFLMECDLLIIDDLGTELSNTFTVSQLFRVVDGRLSAGLGTVISTNLPPNEMRDEFTDRVMSRIMSSYEIIPLYGEDIRVRRKLSGASS